MKPSENCLNVIREFEGCRLQAYLCPAGIPTIGYGHTKGVKLGDVIDQAEADRLLLADAEQFAQEVEKAVRVPLSQNQFDALVSFAFNCKGWRSSTLIKKVNAGDFAGAAEEFPKWRFVNRRESAGLIRRRAAEARLFTGQAPVQA